MAFISEAMSALPIEDLILTPFKAVADAQAKLARTTAQFIAKVGLHNLGAMPGFKKTWESWSQEKKDAWGSDINKYEAVTIDFTYEDGTLDSNGDPLLKQLNVPIIAIIHIPNLCIDSVDLDFKINISQVIKTNSTTPQSVHPGTSTSQTTGMTKVDTAVKITGEIATTTQRDTDQSAVYAISVHAEDKGYPEGLAKLLEILDKAISEKVESPEVADMFTVTAQHDQVLKWLSTHYQDGTIIVDGVEDGSRLRYMDDSGNFL